MLLVLFNKSKLNDFLKFLKNIVIINPIQNSNPAKAKKKKVVDIKTKSSFIIPTTAVYVYNITHIISEYSIIVVKSLLFNKNITNTNQNNNVKKFIQFNNKKNKINRIITQQQLNYYKQLDPQKNYKTHH